MPWAQRAEAFQEHMETGNGLSHGLPDPLAGALVSPIGDNLGRSMFPKSVPFPTLFNFQRTRCRLYKTFRSSPTGS
jgi:hypothetical protein